MDETEGLKWQIREFVVSNILFSDDDFGDDASLLEEGIIDSMGVLELVTFVQSTFGVYVDSLEVTRDNFDSVSKLSAYVRSKRLQGQDGHVGASIPGK